MAQNEHASETYKSMVSISVEAMKALLLINGGAVIAVLSFLGNSDHGITFAAHASLPLSSFVAGVIFSICTFAFSYATQFALFNETVGNGNYHGPRHMTFVAVALVFVVLSLVSFALGCASSIWLLTHCSNY